MTEAELVAMDNAMSPTLWSWNFLEAQGFKNLKTTVFQDNKSTMSLEENGRQSVGKRSRHLNIRYFFVTDVIKKGLIQVEYCPTGDMVADCFTKPLQGLFFKKLKRLVQNQDNWEQLGNLKKQREPRHADPRIKSPKYSRSVLEHEL